MKVEHIIWEDYSGYDTVSGILDICVYWHGGGSDNLIMEGTFHGDADRGACTNHLMGRFDADTMGVSGIILQRVGRIAE